MVRELERRWEEALKEQRRLEEEYARFSRNQPAGLSAGERDQIHALAEELPGLWQAPSYDGSGSPADRPPLGQGGGRHRPWGERTGRRDHPLGRRLEQQPRVGAPGAALPANGRLREAPESNRRASARRDKRWPGWPSS